MILNILSQYIYSVLKIFLVFSIISVKRKNSLSLQETWNGLQFEMEGIPKYLWQVHIEYIFASYWELASICT